MMISREQPMYEVRKVQADLVPHAHENIPFLFLRRTTHMNATQITVLAEVFQVRSAAIPVLTAYRLDVHNGDMATIGGKLAFRLQKAFPGHWFWSRPWIITDIP